MIEAKIGSSICLSKSSLPPAMYDQIVIDLTARNVDKERALSEQTRGANMMPDELALWSERLGDIVLPRGYVHHLEQVARAAGEEISWDSSMQVEPFSDRCFRDWAPADMRDYQRPAMEAMLEWSQGIVKAPTGSGKSRVTLEFIRWAGQRSLVIVGKTSLARQWQDAALEVYGYETGYIGEGVFDVRDLTIATWQTLWARKNEIEDSFWKHWGCVVGDEVQHAGAWSLSELMRMFPAFYRIGVSATPRWDESSWPIVKALFGPVIHEVTHEDVGKHLVTPSVVIVESDFEAEYVGTHYEKGKRIQNNFTAIMGELVRDYDRNVKIAAIAQSEAQDGHHVLIVTRRTEHVKLLLELLVPDAGLDYEVYKLTGAQTGKQARVVAEGISTSPMGTILVSTVAEEALDIPCLDRVILAYPVKKTPLVEQEIGRVTRTAPGKTEAIVYDVVDDGCGPLVGQRLERERLYARRKWSTSIAA